jgi:ribosomal protein L40E
MKTICGKCGAHLSPDVDWCLRCYRPVLRHRAREGDRPEFPDYVRYVPTPPSRRLLVVPEAGSKSTIARFGSSTFGLVVRLLVTAAMVALGLGARALASGWTGSLGSMALAFTVILLGIWAIVAGPVLWSTWRPERPRVLWAGGEVLSVRPARCRPDGPRALVR